VRKKNRTLPTYQVVKNKPSNTNEEEEVIKEIYKKGGGERRPAEGRGSPLSM